MKNSALSIIPGIAHTIISQCQKKPSFLLFPGSLSFLALKI